VLTHRNDAPAPVKTEARTVFRREVAQAARQGEVVVVPLLLSAGGVEGEVESDLRGLAYRFAPPLMPHPNISRWVEAQAEALLAQRGTTALGQGLPAKSRDTISSMSDDTEA